MGYWDSVSFDQHHDKMMKRKHSGALGSTAWQTPEDERRLNSKAASKNKKEIKNLQSQIDALKKQKAKPAAKPKPKPKGDQQIDPVKDSPEISAARKVVNDFQAGQKDNKSPWAQAQADAADSATFGNFNPGGKTSSDEPQKDPQAFADKYKLDLIGSGATKKASEPGDTPMTGKQILAQDKQQGWS